ncbi:MAG TPA: SirB2 family protein [Sphingomicrobium sp.]|nr:SirB2 family protein [Sphingomicrobium sp.]
MEEFYLDIRGIHIGTVILSGTLFLIRVVGHNLLNAKWPMASPLRFIVWSVDTILLTAALMLMTIVQQFPFVDSWLTVKVILLVAYIVIGWWAFRAERKQVRISCSVAALVIFGFIITVARTHNPLGLFSTI